MILFRKRSKDESVGLDQVDERLAMRLLDEESSWGQRSDWEGSVPATGSGSSDVESELLNSRVQRAKSCLDRLVRCRPERCPAESEEDIIPLLVEEIRLRQVLGIDPRIGEYLESLREPEAKRLLALLPGDSRRAEDRDEFAGLAGRYRIDHCIGRGGMGSVYTATDLLLSRRIAVKVASRHNAWWAELMDRERTILAALQHPNIVSVFDSGELTDGRPYYVMQLVEGETLDVYLARESLNLSDRVRIFERIAEAIGYAHLLGIVHRDLKPLNITVSSSGNPHVLDFGLAKHFDVVEEAMPPSLAKGSSITPAATGILGTTMYMSPEQRAGRVARSTSDVYSLGLILRESLPARVPSDLIAIVRRCLAEDPSARYATGLDLAGELARWRQGRPVEAVVRHRWLYRAGKWAVRHRWAAGIAGSAAVMLMVVILVDLAKLRLAHHEAIEHQQLAESNLVLARQSVEAYLTSIVEDPELQERGMHELRVRLATHAATFYESAIATNAGQQRLRSELVENYLQLSKINRILGKTKSSEYLTIRAVEIARELLAEQPGESSHRLLLAQSLRGLGRSQDELGRPTSAQSFQEALVILGPLLDDPRFADRAMALKIETISSLGWLLQHSGSSHLGEAIRWYEQVIDLIQRNRPLAALTPAEAFELHVHHTRLGTCYRRLKNRDQSDSHFELALRINQALLLKDPANPAYLRVLGSSRHIYWSSLLTDQENPRALAELVEGDHAIERSIALQPQIAMPRFYHARNAYWIGRYHHLLKRYEESLVWSNRAVSRLEFLLEREPGYRRWESLWSLAQFQAAEAHLNLGRPESAARIGELSLARLTRMAETGHSPWLSASALRASANWYAQRHRQVGSPDRAEQFLKEVERILPVVTTTPRTGSDFDRDADPS